MVENLKGEDDSSDIGQPGTALGDVQGILEKPQTGDMHAADQEIPGELVDDVISRNSRRS